MDMCWPLYGTGATVNMDNYYMLMTTAIKLHQNTVFCHGTIRPNCKLLPKSALFTAKDVNQHPRGHSVCAVNIDNILIALGRIDNKPVNFISTSDTMKVVSVLRRIRNERVQISALETVARYNRFMGGVDKHDKLRSMFSLGKRHKLKKYYVKLVLFLVDISLTNSWLYYKLVNEEKLKRNGESRADFFLSLAQAMVCQTTYWEAKYKLHRGQPYNLRQRNTRKEVIDDYLPMTHANHEAIIPLINTELCQPCAFSIIPFQLNKKSKNCQVCHFEMRREKWKGVVLCSKHGVHLCTEIQEPRAESEPKLTREGGTYVTDYSWTSNSTSSCWNKFHDFYEPQGLFSKSKLDFTPDKIKFSSYVYTSDLYQKKYLALGIVTGQKSMGNINPKMHMILGEPTITRR
jgi:hypothetical protein